MAATRHFGGGIVEVLSDRGRIRDVYLTKDEESAAMRFHHTKSGRRDGMRVVEYIAPFSGGHVR